MVLFLHLHSGTLKRYTIYSEPTPEYMRHVLTENPRFVSKKEDEC